MNYFTDISIIRFIYNYTYFIYRILFSYLASSSMWYFKSLLRKVSYRLLVVGLPNLPYPGNNSSVR